MSTRTKYTNRFRQTMPQFRLISLLIIIILLAIIGLIIVIRTHAAQTIAVIPSSIVGQQSCNQSMPDQTAQINAWLASLPNGVTAVFGKALCYRTEGVVKIGSKTNFMVDGNGSMLRAFTDGCDDQTPNDGVAYDNCLYPYPGNPGSSEGQHWPRTRSRIDTLNNQNLIIQNIKVNGGNAGGNYNVNLEAQNAFNMYGNTNLTINNVHADQVWGDFLYFGSGDGATVENSDFGEDNGTGSGNGREGMTVWDGSNYTVKNSTFANVKRHSIDVEPDGTSENIDGVYIDNNVFKGDQLGFFSNNSAESHMSNIYVRNNSIFSMDAWAPADPTNIDVNDSTTFKRHNYQFTNNVIFGGIGHHGTPPGILTFTGIDGVVVAGNKGGPVNAPGNVIVRASISRNVVVQNNSVTRAIATGSYNGNNAVCERSNMIGSPLVAAPLTTGATLCPPPVNTADFNGDGRVDILDLGLLAAHFRQVGLGHVDGDANGNGVVDLTDYSILASQWGQSQ